MKKRILLVFFISAVHSGCMYSERSFDDFKQKMHNFLNQMRNYTSCFQKECSEHQRKKVAMVVMKTGGLIVGSLAVLGSMRWGVLKLMNKKRLNKRISQIVKSEENVVRSMVDFFKNEVIAQASGWQVGFEINNQSHKHVTILKKTDHEIDIIFTYDPHDYGYNLQDFLRDMQNLFQEANIAVVLLKKEKGILYEYLPLQEGWAQLLH